MTVCKGHFECYTVPIEDVLNLVIPLTENKVAGNVFIVVFSLTGEAIGMTHFTSSLLLLRLDSVYFNFTL